jgi:hypothetical protein
MKNALQNLSVVVSCLLAINGVCTSTSVAKYDLAAASAVWLFDDGDGDVAEDMTGNGNDGELMNGPEWVDGLYGEALEFNGTNAYVSVPQPVDLPAGSDPRSVMLSFKWDEVKWPAPGIEPMGYGTNGAGLRFGVWIDASKAVGVETCNFGVVTPWKGDTDWHHLAITYPEGETKTDQL